MGKVEGQPAIDLDLEVKTQQACRDGIIAGVMRSAHDVSDGGLAVALAEAAILGERGVVVDAALGGRWDAALFGEAQSRIIVTVVADQTGELERIAANAGAPLSRLGTTGGDRIIIGDLVDVSLSEVTDRWMSGFRDATQNNPPTTA
jgi:phosphoribosylformylglycinamidine synthase